MLGVVAVDKPHAVAAIIRSRTATHFLLGLTGLLVVGGAFWATYRALVGVTLETLGELSSTAIVWLFIVAWIMIWVGLEMLVERAT